uniref:NADH-ubiquinone oxidoreductase chain 4 n=1 Tax=Ugyops sp. APL-2018 TaxID=2250388 RepID=A0A3G1RJA5_9HEMI|nr:NADH dehydrogenase subunit 4 [Ugyops sp. APL-2018]
MLSLFFFFLSLIPICFFSFWYLYIYFMFFFFFFFFINFRFYDFFSFISFGFGMDFYSYGFCLLSIWICILMAYSMINYSVSLYSFYYLLNLNFLVFFLVICFLSIDFFSFYFFFECSVLPVFFLILGWGYQPERLSSGFYLLFYTLFSSLPFLLIIFYLSITEGYFYFDLDYSCLNFYFFFFFIFSFLVSFPMFMFHFWLPSAHVEAPSSGSMILAGVMLKLGGYGLIRVFKFLVDYVIYYSFFFISVSLMGSFFISVFCLLQSDMKVLVAYSSVSHMGLVICSLFTLFDYGFLGSYFLMISHGLVSSGLFYFIGCLYDRFCSRSLFVVKGLMNFLPSFTFFFFFFCVCNMSCPPSLNLFSEICIIFSLVTWSFYTFFFLFFILFFTACYSIYLFSFSHHGGFSGLIFFVDGGLIREYLIFFLHIFPVFFIVFNLHFFF